MIPSRKRPEPFLIVSGLELRPEKDGSYVIPAGTKVTVLNQGADDDETYERFGGPAEPIGASVPRELTRAIRAALAGKRGFSRFVTRALARELIDRNRATYVAEMEKVHGPLDREYVARLERLLRGR